MSWVKKSRYLLAFIILCLVSSLVFRGQAHALSQDITISPPVFDLVLQPGQTYSGSFNVIDQGVGTYNFIVYSDPYSVQGEEYNPDFQPIPGATNPGNWFKFSINKDSLSPGQSVPVNYTIQVPPKQLSGGYYAVAFAETQNPQASQQGVTINERVGSLFFMQVGGNVVKKGSLVSWKTNGWFQKPPLTSDIRIEDSGSVHFTVQYHYVVSDVFGDPKFVVNGEKILLPQTIRRIDLVWQGSPKFGLYKVSGKVSFLNQTDQLGTKYVLVMSSNARLYSLMVLIGLLLLYIFTGPLRHRKQKVKEKEKSDAKKA